MGPQQSILRPPDYASRAGGKLAHALGSFSLDVSELICVDFGCNVGGFTDCLLRHGAARVYAVDTGYGVLADRLRRHQRVVVRERANALHADPPSEPMDLVTIDLGWTRQRHAIPAALKWLSPRGLIITLIKPHYELDSDERAAWLTDGVLGAPHAEAVCQRVAASLPGLGVRVLGRTTSPITGAKSARRGKGKGNREYLVLAAPAN